MINSIRVRVLIATILPLLVLAVILGYYSITFRMEDSRNGIESQAKSYAEYFSAASEFNLLAGDENALQQFIDTQIRATSQFLAVLLVVDSEGKLLASSGDEKEKELAFDCLNEKNQCVELKNRQFFKMPIYASEFMVNDNPEFGPVGKNINPEMLGQVAFYYNTQSLVDLQKQMVFDGLLITTVSAFAALILSLGFSNRIVRPILKLSSVVNSIQKGDLTARVKPTGRGELRELEIGINSMAAIVEQGKEDLQKKIEIATEKLISTLIELKQKNSDLESAKADAEEASKIKDLFLARMSHELRTPIAAIIGYLRLLEESTDRVDRKNYGKIIDQASSILLSTIDDILEFIRFEDGSVRLENIKFNLIECLNTAVAMQIPEADKKEIKLSCNVEECLTLPVYGDPARLAQIIANLLSNAIKFTSHGSVSLNAKTKIVDQSMAELLVSVVDTGIGISEELQSNLFKPFVQADDSISRRFGGSGLGLSISMRLAQSMNGNITLRSEVGIGTEVTFTAQFQLQGSENKIYRCLECLSGPDQEVINRKKLSSTETVLLVEDNDLNRQLIRIQFESAGVNVIDVENGYMALDSVDDTKFDFILMDVHLPGMDGVSLAKKLKSRAPEIPIYAVTANITGSEEKQLFDAGVSRILYKPLSEPIIHSILNGSGTINSENITDNSSTTIDYVSHFILPKGIDEKDVLAEFNKLIILIRDSLKEENWPNLVDYSHKLLGSARLFTRGPLSDFALKLEIASQEKRVADVRIAIKDIVEQLKVLQII